MAAYKNKIDRGYRQKPHYFILIVLSKDPLTGTSDIENIKLFNGHTNI